MNIHQWAEKKRRQEKIIVLTCYDYWSAKNLANTETDCLLVGDSLGMVMHGYPNTLPVTVDMMVLHTQAVRRAAGKKFVLTDLPFLSFRKGLKACMQAVEKIMQAGAEAIKIEGVSGHEKIIEHIVQSGVPVMGHLGLTPQSVHQLGGFVVQARDEKHIQKIQHDAKQLENLGCFAVVLECIPSTVAEKITQQLTIPTIGIGAGKAVDGQVLVLHDLLGLQADFKLKFVPDLLDGAAIFQKTIQSYIHAVKTRDIPTREQSYDE